eukprot:TRINITY_DN6486_c0_g1_i27.p2 TRINITY_DN6486_c0_g1~~TRINITY_DN6486_c0_g1_i27.p2  ORF type:complete len:186 (+),score=22.22 TRINITY_DN6486_c0_g1_i27:83-640(+)
MYRKREEFTLWLQEIKNTSLENLSHVAEKKFFEEYVEDYNTCTLPSKKFYDVRRWEMKLQKKLAKKERKRDKKEREKDLGGTHTGSGDFRVMRDEVEKRKEYKEKMDMQKRTQVYIQTIENFYEGRERVMSYFRLRNDTHYSTSVLAFGNARNSKPEKLDATSLQNRRYGAGQQNPEKARATSRH